jgi:DNA-binding transcriptional MerR regulator
MLRQHVITTIGYKTLMYTPDQVSQMLKIPLSTLRRYSNQYAFYLSTHTKQQRRRYTEQDIVVLARARELLNSGKSPEQVSSLLSVISSEEIQPDQTLALIPSISQALQSALDTSRALRAELDTLKIETENTLAEITERLAQIESDQHKSWISKLFQRDK